MNKSLRTRLRLCFPEKVILHISDRKEVSRDTGTKLKLGCVRIISVREGTSRGHSLRPLSALICTPHSAPNCLPKNEGIMIFGTHW
jgi:hypothetical protein